jgi:hypothetical protein
MESATRLLDLLARLLVLRCGTVFLLGVFLRNAPLTLLFRHRRKIWHGNNLPPSLFSLLATETPFPIAP